MIVRISGEGQYEMPDGVGDELNELDNRVVAAVEDHDEVGFRHAFDALLAAVRRHGTELAADDLRESTLIIPPADTTLGEAERDFTGDGLLPD